MEISDFRGAYQWVGQVAYCQDEFGVIHQVDQNPVRYGPEYIERNYSRRVPEPLMRGMAALRLGHLLSVFGRENVRSVLDVGYGRGDFLKAVAGAGMLAYGYDVGGMRLPPGPLFIEIGAPEGSEGSPVRPPVGVFHPYSVVTFYDSLEHFEWIDWVKDLRASGVLISVPWCHWGLDDPAFACWAHRKPDEHLHHFGVLSLVKWMGAMGWEAFARSNIEDAIRGPSGLVAQLGLPNILTMAFRRKGSG